MSSTFSVHVEETAVNAADKLYGFILSSFFWVKSAQEQVELLCKI